MGPLGPPGPPRTLPVTECQVCPAPAPPPSTNLGPQLPSKPSGDPSPVGIQDQYAMGPRSNPKIPAEGPELGTGLCGHRATMQGTQNSYTGINRMLLLLGPQAYGHSGCFEGHQWEGDTRGTSAPPWFAGFWGSRCLGWGSLPLPLPSPPSRLSQGPAHPTAGQQPWVSLPERGARVTASPGEVLAVATTIATVVLQRATQARAAC